MSGSLDSHVPTNPRRGQHGHAEVLPERIVVHAQGDGEPTQRCGLHLLAGLPRPDGTRRNVVRVPERVVRQAARLHRLFEPLRVHLSASFTAPARLFLLKVELHLGQTTDIPVLIHHPLAQGRHAGREGVEHVLDGRRRLHVFVLRLVLGLDPDVQRHLLRGEPDEYGPRLLGRQVLESPALRVLRAEAPALRMVVLRGDKRKRRDRHAAGVLPGLSVLSQLHQNSGELPRDVLVVHTPAVHAGRRIALGILLQVSQNRRVHLPLVLEVSGRRLVEHLLADDAAAHVRRPLKLADSLIAGTAHENKRRLRVDAPALVLQFVLRAKHPWHPTLVEGLGERLAELDLRPGPEAQLERLLPALRCQQAVRPDEEHALLAPDQRELSLDGVAGAVQQAHLGPAPSLSVHVFLSQSFQNAVLDSTVRPLRMKSTNTSHWPYLATRNFARSRMLFWNAAQDSVGSLNTVTETDRSRTMRP